MKRKVKFLETKTDRENNIIAFSEGEVREVNSTRSGIEFDVWAPRKGEYVHYEFTKDSRGLVYEFVEE